MNYTAEGKFATEEEAKADLATCEYAGKWKKAQDSVLRDKNWLAVDPPAYWDAVRLYFLELGGEWKAQITKPAPIDWNAPIYPSIPKFEYREPTKVRFA